MGKIIEAACEFAVQLANDDSHGYDQINRWLPNVDCSSLVVLCYEHAGIPVKKAGATYTGNLKRGFEKCGFTVIPFKPVKPVLKRGDVLFYHYVRDKKTYGHAIIYLGNGQIVQASINEKGTATGGKTGDQTKREVAVGKFYIPAHGWDYVLRYEKDEEKEDLTVDITMPVLQKGSRCAEVGTMQTLLNALGFKGANGRALTVDHDFGKNCKCAVENFQKASGIKDDGICGQKTWSALLSANY